MRINQLTILISLMVLALFCSCQKEQGTVQNNDTGQTYTPEAMAIWSKLNNFNQKIKFGLKAEEYISSDSAIWYLEALLNVKHATDTTFDDVLTFKKSYQLPKNDDGTVSMSRVVEFYNVLVDDIQAQLDGIESEYNFLIIADLQQSTLKSDAVEVELNAGFGINPLALYEPITEDDNWFYGNMLGRCDGTFFGQSDAGQELKRRFNNPKMELPFPHNSWINVFKTDVLSHENYPGRIYYEVSPSAPCIEYDELRYLLTQGHYIIYNDSTDVVPGEKPPLLYFRMLDLWTNNPNPADSTYWHKYQIMYGTPVHIPPID